MFILCFFHGISVGVPIDISDLTSDQLHAYISVQLELGREVRIFKKEEEEVKYEEEAL